MKVTVYVLSFVLCFLVLTSVTSKAADVAIGQKALLFLSPSEMIYGFVDESTFDYAVNMSMNSVMKTFDPETMKPANFEEHGYDGLIQAKKCVKLQPNTQVLMLGRGGQLSIGRRVKILTGKEVGKTWWVVKDALNKL